MFFPFHGFGFISQAKKAQEAELSALFDEALLTGVKKVPCNLYSSWCSEMRYIPNIWGREGGREGTRCRTAVWHQRVLGRREGGGVDETCYDRAILNVHVLFDLPPSGGWVCFGSKVVSSLAGEMGSQRTPFFAVYYRVYTIGAIGPRPSRSYCRLVHVVPMCASGPNVKIGYFCPLLQISAFFCKEFA